MAIAIAGVIDPVITRQVVERPRVTLVTLHDGLVPAARRLAAEWAHEFDVLVSRAGDMPGAAACPSTGACVLLSDGRSPARLTAGADVAGVVRDSSPAGPDVLIAGIEAPPRVHLDAAAALKVRLRRPAPRVEVFDGDVLVGTTEAASAGIVDVRWVPVGAGARRLRVQAGGDAADVGVVVESAPAPVLVYEPEPGWLGTFVRRALEEDPALVVGSRAQVAPAVALVQGEAPRLDRRTLDAVSAVVVGAPSALAAAEVDLLERFVKRRAGSLVVLADRRAAGPARRLLPEVEGVYDARDMRPVGPLRASEWVAFAEAPDIAVLERRGEAAVIVARTVGRGRVIAAGALDAWRRRDAHFAAFWRTLVRDAAAAGQPLTVTASPALAAPGEEIAVEIERRWLDAAPTEIVAAAAVDCGGRRRTLRLWPEARPGAFGARLRAEAAGECRIEASIDGAVASGGFLVTGDLRRIPEDEGRLESMVRAAGGLVVTPEHVGDLASQIRARHAAPLVARVMHPMRSPLWLIPFVACLAGEWWLRRRGGER